MRDHQDGHVLLFNELVQFSQDLILDGDVQVGCRLVGQQQSGRRDQRFGNADALSHPAAQLHGVAGHDSFWIWHASLLERGNTPSCYLLSCKFLIGVSQGILHDIPKLSSNCEYGVKRRQGVLEYRRYLPSSEVSNLSALHLQDVLAAIDDLPASNPCWWRRENPQDGSNGGRLSAARLPNETDPLPLSELEVHPVQNA